MPKNFFRLLLLRTSLSSSEYSKISKIIEIIPWVSDFAFLNNRIFTWVRDFSTNSVQSFWCALVYPSAMRSDLFACFSLSTVRVVLCLSLHFLFPYFFHLNLYQKNLFFLNLHLPPLYFFYAYLIWSNFMSQHYTFGILFDGLLILAVIIHQIVTVKEIGILEFKC